MQSKGIQIDNVINAALLWKELLVFLPGKNTSSHSSIPSIALNGMISLLHVGQ